ncbi:MAG: glucose 1-dehydrogenase [Alphaproteobacteria bacterium]|jgi:NAD(P)-dependent dehydrogenase (short-subunit alcohol dehydrogenase family)|nr:glucose 1-dehydrogenase [Alphaproteobacteria bacterium]
MRLRDKVALVTGAAGGIGRQTALRMAEAGARVFLADLDRAAGEAIAAEIGGETRFLSLDVTDEAAWQATIGEVVSTAGRLQVLVNGAGIIGSGAPQDPERGTLEDLRAINGVNLEGVFLGCKHAIPALREAGGGSIVNISSLAAMQATPQTTAYGISKAGVCQLTKSVAMHCARRRYGVRCNSIHPGIIDTAMATAIFGWGERDAERGRERYIDMVPLGHLGEPDDIAYAALYLASDESKFVTGAEFVIDGGMSIY